MKNYLRNAKPLLIVMLTCLTSLSVQAQIIVDRDLKILRGQQQIKPSSVNDAVKLKNTPTLTGTVATTQNTPVNTNSYMSEVVSPSLYVRSTPYFVNFPLTQSIPDGLTITNVSWIYTLSQHPLGTEVILCWNKNEVCQDVSLFESGHTSMFNGKNPLGTFTLYYRLGGKGAISPPINGGKTQIIVTYTKM